MQQQLPTFCKAAMITLKPIQQSSLPETKTQIHKIRCDLRSIKGSKRNFGFCSPSISIKHRLSGNTANNKMLHSLIADATSVSSCAYVLNINCMNNIRSLALLLLLLDCPNQHYPKDEQFFLFQSVMTMTFPYCHCFIFICFIRTVWILFSFEF